MSTRYPDISSNPMIRNDIEKLLLDERASSEDGWKLMKEDDEIQVWQKKDPKCPVNLVKGFITFKDIPHTIVADIYNDEECRTKWDKLCSVVEVLETFEDHKIVYRRYSMPLGMSDREGIQKVYKHYDASTDTSYIFGYQTTHQEKLPQKDVIRSEILSNGLIIRQHPDLCNSTKITTVSQTDMKGWIPSALINSFGTRIVSNLHQGISGYYRKAFLQDDD